MPENETGGNPPSGLAQWGMPPARRDVKDIEFGDGVRLRIWADQELERVVIQIDEVPRESVVTTLDADGPVGVRLQLGESAGGRLAKILCDLRRGLGWIEDR